jgi:hypothetical protein
MTVLLSLYAFFPERRGDPIFFGGSIVAAGLVAIAFWWAFERHYRVLAMWLKARRAPVLVAA